jgi:hypothetical protein
MKYTHKILIAITAIALFTLPASAERGKGKKNGPCKADIEKFCGDKKGDRKAMKACIKENKDKFSAECKAKKEEHKAKHAERKAKMSKALETCAPDIQKLCPDANVAGAKKHAGLKCLMQNRDKVSDTCKAALPEKRVRKEK